MFLSAFQHNPHEVGLSFRKRIKLCPSKIHRNLSVLWASTNQYHTRNIILCKVYNSSLPGVRLKLKFSWKLLLFFISRCLINTSITRMIHSSERFMNIFLTYMCESSSVDEETSNRCSGTRSIKLCRDWCLHKAYYLVRWWRTTTGRDIAVGCSKCKGSTDPTFPGRLLLAEDWED